MESWGYLAYTNLALNPNCHLALITLTLKQGADVCDGCFWVGAGQTSSHVITAAAYISVIMPLERQSSAMTRGWSEIKTG